MPQKASRSTAKRKQGAASARSPARTHKPAPKAGRKTSGATVALSPASSPLAELLPTFICECRGSLIVALNAGGRALLGYSRGAKGTLLGQSFATLIADPMAARLTRSLAPLAAGKQPKHVSLLGKNGIPIPVSLRAVRLDKAAAGRVLIVAEPVTASAAAAASPKDQATALGLGAVMESLISGVIVVDGKARIRFANAAAHRLLGMAWPTLRGMVLDTVVADWAGDGVLDARNDRDVVVRSALLGQVRDVVAARADGGHFPAEVTVTAIEGGAGAAFTVLINDASARKAAETATRSYADRLAQEVEVRTAELRTLSRQNQRILEAASDGIVAVALDGTIQSANRAAADMLNRDVSGLVGLALDRAFVFGSGTTMGTPGRAAPLRAQLWNGPFHVSLEARLARTDGESFDAEYTIAPITEGRETRGYVVTFRDISERKRAETEMLLSAAVFENSLEGLLIADSRGRVSKTNPAFRRITGFEPSDVIGKLLSDVLFAEAKASPGVLDPLRTVTQTEWEQWCKSKSGKRYAARITMSVVRDNDGKVQQYAAILSDITQRKLDEEKILYQANYDQLTGLANRTLFMDRLTRQVVETKRAKTNVGLMFIDLDGFKAINDTLGHDAGDLLLKGCARRLEKCVRESDTVARLGGDEFTVIMPMIDSIEAAAVVADRIIRSLCEVFDLDGRPGHVSASIGISILPGQASDASSLLHNADVAMYQAKRLGKANYQFYKPGLEANPERAGRA